MRIGLGWRQALSECSRRRPHSVLEGPRNPTCDLKESEPDKIGLPGEAGWNTEGVECQGGVRFGC